MRRLAESMLPLESFCTPSSVSSAALFCEQTWIAAPSIRMPVKLTLTVAALFAVAFGTITLLNKPPFPLRENPFVV